MGFRKADDFYIALGGAKISPKVVVNKVLQRLKQGESAEAEEHGRRRPAQARRIRRKPEAQSSQFGIRVEGVDDVPLRLAKCCRPVSGDPILGYVSLGRGITIHREDCPNADALRKDPERFVPVSWDGDNETSFKVEIQVDAWDRHRLLEDLSRTFAEGGINIVEAYCIVQHPMVKNRFVIEVADTQTLKIAINRVRSIDSVFDAYRVIRRRLTAQSPHGRICRSIMRGHSGDWLLTCSSRPSDVATMLAESARPGCQASRRRGFAPATTPVERGGAPSPAAGRRAAVASPSTMRARHQRRSAPGSTRAARPRRHVVAVDLERDRRRRPSGRARGCRSDAMPRCLAIRPRDSARNVTVGTSYGRARVSITPDRSPESSAGAFHEVDRPAS